MSDTECVWTQVEEYDYTYWESDCEDLFSFNEGGPHHNSFVYCPYCGLLLKEKKIEPDYQGEGVA